MKKQDPSSTQGTVPSNPLPDEWIVTPDAKSTALIGNADLRAH